MQALLLKLLVPMQRLKDIKFERQGVSLVIAIFFEIRETATKVIFATPSPPPMNMHRFMYILKIATPSPSPYVHAHLMYIDAPKHQMCTHAQRSAVINRTFREY